MKKRILACLLAAMLVTPMLFSCGGATTETKVTTDTTPAAETETEAETLALPDYDLDLGGADFNVLFFDHVAAWGWNSNMPSDIRATEEMTGDVLSDAVYMRNMKIEEMYNLKVNAIASDGTNIHSQLERSVLASAGEYDSALLLQQGMEKPVTSGILLQLDDALDFTNPWWDSNSLAGLSICGKTYAVAGDLTFTDKLIAIGIFFNKNMAIDYNLGDIYELVISGDWTYDTMLQYGEMVSADLDNNEKYDKNDRYGFAGQDDAAYEFFHSAGERFCSIDGDGIPYMSNTSERAITVMSRIYEFMNNTQQFFNRGKANLSIADAIKMFMSDQVLFLMRPLSTLFDLRAMEAEFGIIPTPKMDEQQEQYYTSIGFTGSPLITIPVDAKSVENSAMVLETLCAESYFSVNEAFYDTALGSKLTRDENSTENLDLILNNRIYDPGCIFAFGGMINSFFKSGDPGTVASTVETFKSKVETDIQKFVDLLSE